MQIESLKAVNTSSASMNRFMQTTIMAQKSKPLTRYHKIV